MDVSTPADVHVPARAGDIVAPRYGTASLAELVPSLLAHLAGRSADAALALPGLGSRVVVLVVDGLGSLQLARHAEVAPLLRSLTGDVDAVFPSTTVSSLASIGTGLPPSQHGLVGYTMALPDHDHPLAGLRWHIGLRGGGFDAREVVVPEEFQPRPTMFEQAVEAGVDTTVVLAPGLVASGLTRAGLRGGRPATAVGLAATLRTALEAVAGAAGPAIAYAHHAEVDHAGHEDGVGSPRWLDAVAEVDGVLRRLAPTLPSGVSVVVTADHGMLNVPGDRRIDLADDPTLLDGVRVMAGEPRVRSLTLEDGVDAHEVAGRWRAALGDAVLVATRAEALPWFGPDATPDAVRRIGDLVVIARRGTLVHERHDPRGARHLGQHGGPTRAERLVPLRIVSNP